jgi:hypothetical protein
VLFYPFIYLVWRNLHTWAAWIKPNKVGIPVIIHLHNDGSNLLSGSLVQNHRILLSEIIVLQQQMYAHHMVGQCLYHSSVDDQSIYLIDIEIIFFTTHLWVPCLGDNELHENKLFYLDNNTICDDVHHLQDTEINENNFFCLDNNTICDHAHHAHHSLLYFQMLCRLKCYKKAAFLHYLYNTISDGTVKPKHICLHIQHL